MPTDKQVEAFNEFVLAADKYIKELESELAEQREANGYLLETIKRLSRADAVDTGTDIS